MVAAAAAVVCASPRNRACRPAEAAAWANALTDPSARDAAMKSVFAGAVADAFARELFEQQRRDVSAPVVTNVDEQPLAIELAQEAAVKLREDMHSTALDVGVALLHPRRPMANNTLLV